MNAPTTPALFTASVTTLLETSVVVGPTGTPGRFHVLPWSFDATTRMGPPPDCRHPKYNRSRDASSDASTTSADSWNIGGGPQTSLTSDGVEKVDAPLSDRIIQARRRSKRGGDRVSSTNETISVPSARTTGISPPLCSPFGDTTVGSSNDFPPSRERTTKTPVALSPLPSRHERVVVM